MYWNFTLKTTGCSDYISFVVGRTWSTGRTWGSRRYCKLEFFPASYVFNCLPSRKITSVFWCDLDRNCKSNAITCATHSCRWSWRTQKWTSPEKLTDTFKHVSLEFATLYLSENYFCEVWPISRAWFKARLRLACKVACEQALLLGRGKRDARERGSEDFSRYPPNGQLALRLPASKLSIWSGGGLQKSHKHCTWKEMQVQPPLTRSRVLSLCSPQAKDKKCLTSATQHIYEMTSNDTKID